MVDWISANWAVLFSWGCFWEQDPSTSHQWGPRGGWGGQLGSGGCVFSLSSRLTNGINQSSETWQFSPNRPIFPFSLISLMLWKTPEAKGSQASEAEEGRFSTGCLVQACHLYREHLLPILRPSSPASSPSWYPPDPPAPSKWAFGGVWWRLRSASKPPPTLLPTHFGYCLDGGGDWINKAVKSSNVAHRKGFRARKRQLPLLSALEQKIVSCT